MKCSSAGHVVRKHGYSRSATCFAAVAHEHLAEGPHLLPACMVKASCRFNGHFQFKKGSLEWLRNSATTSEFITERHRFDRVALCRRQDRPALLIALAYFTSASALSIVATAMKRLSYLVGSLARRLHPVAQCPGRRHLVIRSEGDAGMQPSPNAAGR